MPQSQKPSRVLSFATAACAQPLTSQAGMLLLGEFLHHIDFQSFANKCLPANQRHQGYTAGEMLMSLILLLNIGGRHLDDVRQLDEDELLKQLLPLQVPSSYAIGDWLRRKGMEGVAGCFHLNRQLLSMFLAGGGRTQHTLDIDATGIVANKAGAEYTYKGHAGYMPVVAHLAHSNWIVHTEFREGNVAPAFDLLSVIQKSMAAMPKGHRITKLRADAATYQREIFEYCEQENIQYAIGAKQSAYLREKIAAIPAYEWQAYDGAWVAEIAHQMNGMAKPFRLIVVSYSQQHTLFDDGTFYHLVATNLSGSVAKVLEWYRQRGDKSENNIKELKNGFGMAHMPCGQFEANALFFSIGALANNLFHWFKQVALEDHLQHHTVKTIRWKIFQMPAKLMTHARRVVLKMAQAHLTVFEQIRLKIAQFVRPLLT